MTDQSSQLDIASSLCCYDSRHPAYQLVYGDDADAPLARQPGCACDNCFYGRDALALEVLRLRDAEQVWRIRFRLLLRSLRQL